MNTWFIYIFVIITAIAAIVVRRDTKELIRRSDQIQKSLNRYIERERKHNAK